ncbi:hypothetical protein RZS08_43590, partial [Arthrospira platensis SPKY1]|nr:hypothetical protein [Arthrospira platensis SPKY1]
AHDDFFGLVDEAHRFKGLIHAKELREQLLEGLNLDMETGVLVIELMPADLSLSKIVQLIEEEGAKVLGLTVHQPRHEDSPFLVSIKLNTPDTLRITASLRRFQFVVND